jgi:hypothetical protein
MSKIIKISTIACLAILLFACKEDDNSEEAPYFGVEAKFLTQTFESEADVRYVTVRTNQTFTATSSESWCTTEVLSDKTADNLKISVNALNAATPRTATVTVACQGFESAVITVTQDGVAVTISVTPNEPADIEASGGNVTFTVTADAAWGYTVTSEDGDWLTETETGTATTLTLTAAVNNGDSPRNATLRFFLTDYPDQSQEITVSQAVFQAQLNVTHPAAMYIARTGGNITFDIDANTEWEFDIEDNWLTKTGESATTLIVTAENNTSVIRKTVVTISLTNYPDISYSYTVGQLGSADMLDVVFNTDGTATDISPMSHPVLWKNYDNHLTVTRNATYDRNEVIFNPSANGATPGANKGSYYQIDYKDNADFKNKLADGHSFECLIKFDVNFATVAPGYETKFFSTHDGGGTGFMIANNSQGTGPNGITFLPNIPTTNGGSSNWIWANSQIKPDGQSYYHLIGVWDQIAGKSYLYVNGELKSEKNAAGFLRFPGSDACHWIAIGGDAGTDRIEAMFQGRMVIARIYDSPLTAVEAQTLYNEIKPE